MCTRATNTSVTIARECKLFVAALLQNNVPAPWHPPPQHHSEAWQLLVVVLMSLSLSALLLFLMLPALRVLTLLRLLLLRSRRA